jgi:hypothetical protein
VLAARAIDSERIVGHLMRDNSQFTCVLFDPCIDGRNPLDGALNRSNSVLIVAPLSTLANGAIFYNPDPDCRQHGNYP